MQRTATKLVAARFVVARLDDPLSSSSATHGLRRPTRHLLVACQESRLVSGDMCCVRELSCWPQVLEGRVPDHRCRLDAEVACHQVEPAVDDPRVEMRITAWHIARHRGWLRIC